MVDFNKEIKLSDLFKRGKKASAESEAAPNGKAEKPPKAPKPPKPPKESRWRKERTPKAAASTELSAHDAPPPLDVPLMRAFNLLPKEEVREQQERGNPLPYILIALAGVLVFAALAAFYLMAGTDVTKKKSEADDLRAELAVYQQSAQQDTLDNKESELATERVTRTASLAAALGSRLAWDRLLREIALVVPDEVSLSQIQGNAPLAASTTTAADGSAVNDLTIVGSTANEASVAEFMARLSVISQLESVRLKEAGESPADPEKVVFTITATFRRAA